MLGLLLINKPQNITSYGAVARVKRITGEKRVGHTGTLDPMATGVLPVLVGRATALSAFLIDADKAYTARIKLGVTTDTCDITGEVISEKTVSVTDQEIKIAVSSLVGEIEQTPPAYSAIKVGGERLYKLAREGKEVEIPSRKITVYSAEIISPLDENNEFSVRFKVSKGTYIRSLARDIGEKLGCGATLSALCRIKTCGFDISQCVSLDELTPDNLEQYILSPDCAVGYMPEVSVTEKQAARFSNGGQLGFERLKGIIPQNGKMYRVKCGGELIGIGECDCEKQELAVKCVIKLPEKGETPNG